MCALNSEAIAEIRDNIINYNLSNFWKNLKYLQDYLDYSGYSLKTFSCLLKKGSLYV